MVQVWIRDVRHALRCLKYRGARTSSQCVGCRVERFVSVLSILNSRIACVIGEHVFIEIMFNLKTIYKTYQMVT